MAADAVQIGAKRVVSEVFFPQARSELGHILGGVLTRAL
jgi:hypothetical protein